MGLKVVIIGAVAAGPKAGCRLKRVLPKAQVVMVDRDECFSYGGCGIPYYVSGDVTDLEGLRSTSFHMLRDVKFFKGSKGIDVLAGWEALNIDRQAKEVLVREIKTGNQKRLGYDKLVLATGSRPHLPPLDGLDLAGVMPVANLHQAKAIKDAVAQGQVSRAAVVGSGPTGLEMAEALADLWGVEVILLEMADQVLPGLLEADLARFVENHLKEQGIELRLGAKVEGFIGQEGRIKGIRFNGQEREVDLALLATGVRPDIDLAVQAGLETSPLGGLVVNDRLQTSDPDIFAGGDCVVNRCLISGGETYLSSGSVANRQGRVIGTNLAGGQARFPGVVGSWIMKVFELNAAKVGLTAAAAKKAGFDPVSALVVQTDRAHFYPTRELMYLKMVADRTSRRVLGLQGVAPTGDALSARIDALAALLPAKPTVEDVSNLELAYAPPFASAMDVLNAAANALDNALDGRLRDIGPEEFSRLLNQPDGQTVFLDIRTMTDARPYLEALADRGWIHLPQETLADRLAKLPRGKDLVLICKSGARSYEAQVTLTE
ncbi:MAG: FAD-dependent oxidoreductase, partial [Deltaproteobacteria bacterium]|nr:FAD-dependent oxidoreductase [Deltaproteobacteria bacterium]